MIKMQTLNEIISLLRIVVIPLGSVCRVVFCLIKMIYDEDAMNSYKKKIWNVVAFLIISELIFVVVDIIKFYYGDYIL
ncbi:MAG: mercury transporter [Candidatus Scatovivens sp.]